MTDPQPEATPALPARFDELSLSELTMRAIHDMGYESPTPVQAGAVPIALTGRDVMVQSQTGTGKTAAFSLPLIEQICARDGRRGVSAIVLAPTRELARQVAQEMGQLAAHHELEICTIYGGTPFDPQVEQLKTTDVVVGTPGRVVDHLKRRTLKLDAVRHFVLDEADEMLSMGFAEELEEVRKRLPKQRQTLFFSATFPPAVKRYSERTLKEPELLSFLDESSSADDLEHAYYMVRGLARSTPLTKILLDEDPKNAIIFVNTRRDCELVMKALKRVGLDADRLSGDMDQKERERVMAKMKRKALRFLVATDVAARGIDISQLSHVIHYQLPDSPEVYIHRSGRTGRAGEKGTVLSLIGPQEIGVLYALKRFHHLKLIERELPQGAPKAKPRSAQAQSEPLKPAADKPAARKPVRAKPAASKPVRASKLVKAEAKRTQNAELQPTRVAAEQPAPERLSRRRRPQRPSSLIESLSLASEDLSPERHRAEAEALLAHDQALDLVRALINKAEGCAEPKPRVKAAPSKAAPSKTARPRGEGAQTASSQARRGGASAASRRGAFDQLSVNIGLRDLSDVAALKRLLAELGGLLPEDISSVQMRRSFSQIEVAREYSADLIDALTGELHEGRKIEVKPVS